MRRADRLAPPRALIAWSTTGAAVLVLSLIVPTSAAFLMTTAAVYAILALSLNPILGGAGMLSMCQLSFAAAGAATMGALSGRIPFLLALLVAAASAVPVGLLLGGISLRLRGVSFAAASLGLAAAVQIIISHNALPGFQSGGAVSVPAPLDSTRGYLLFVLACLAAVSLAVWRLRSARVGRTWSITRFSERAAASVGVSVPLAKLSATAVGAAIAGLGGALMVSQYGFITADAVAPINGLVLLVVAMVAGVRSVTGAWLAGVFFVVIPQFLTNLGLPGDIATVLFGLAAVQVLATGGDGIVGQIQALSERRRRRRRLPVALTVDIDRLVDVDESAPRTGTRPTLELTELTVDYGAVRALDAVSLRLQPGVVTGLIGPNGAGKSTLIDAVTGFLPAYSGQVVLGGRPLEGTSAKARARAGMRRTFQQSRIPPDMPVSAYLELCAGRRSGAETRHLVSGLAADTRVGDLDIPTRRLVEVAGAFAGEPDVVLLDEPAAGLSEADSLALGHMVHRLAERLGVAVLLIEHDVEMVRECCDQLCVLDFGRVIAAGDPSAVLTTAHVVAAYLGGHKSGEATA